MSELFFLLLPFLLSIRIWLIQLYSQSTYTSSYSGLLPQHSCPSKNSVPSENSDSEGNMITICDWHLGSRQIEASSDPDFTGERKKKTFHDTTDHRSGLEVTINIKWNRTQGYTQTSRIGGKALLSWFVLLLFSDRKVTHSPCINYGCKFQQNVNSNDLILKMSLLKGK